jgi:hypothetical protein
MVKFLLNRIPRGILQRAAGILVPIAGIFYAIGRSRGGVGGDVECPLCGARYRRFRPYGYVSVRHNALCPKCLALERHRLLWLWLTRETDLLSSAPRFLHIAPEICLSRRFEKIFPAKNYVTADLESPLANVKMDVQKIPFSDGEFDVIFCNHVLEHVDNDRLAMCEMFRVMRPGGWGVMLSPVDETRDETFEDDTVTDPAERTKIFGQYDHKRIYGRDYADRLRETGWQVDEIDYFAALTPEERSRFGLRSEILYVVRKR